MFWRVAWSCSLLSCLYLGWECARSSNVFLPYESLDDGRVVNHAHNDYLELLADTGLAGGFCCAWFLGVLFFRSLKQLLATDKSFAAALHLSGLVACCGFLVHSLVDFNLHMPGNGLLFLLMAYLATAEIHASPSKRNSRSSISVETKSLIDNSLTAV